MSDPRGIETLLDMNDQIIVQENGFWIKVEAWRVPTSKDMPYGIRYSLTLHNNYGTRILGYDNAHAIKPPKKFKFAGQRLPFDHKHRTASDKGVPYNFEDAYQLMADFFAEVDLVMREAMSK